MWKHYFDKINAVIFVIDSTDRDRLPKASQHLIKVCKDADLGDAPILILANKQDMTHNQNLMTPEEIEKTLNLDEIRNKMNESGVQREIAFQGCSAVTGEGIWEGIGILQEIMENYQKNPTKQDQTMVSKDSKDTMEKSQIKSQSL